MTDKYPQENKIPTFKEKMLVLQALEVKIPKEKKGVYGKYMSLDTILEVYKEHLSDQRLFISHQLLIEFGEYVLKTTLHDVESESFIMSVFPMTKNDNPQKVGSQITYAKRYNICALLNIASDEDDDGEGAKKANESKPKTLPNATDEDMKNIMDRLKELSVDNKQPKTAEDVITPLLEKYNLTDKQKDQIIQFYKS